MPQNRLTNITYSRGSRGRVEVWKQALGKRMEELRTGAPLANHSVKPPGHLSTQHPISAFCFFLYF